MYRSGTERAKLCWVRSRNRSNDSSFRLSPGVGFLLLSGLLFPRALEAQVLYDGALSGGAAGEAPFLDDSIGAYLIPAEDGSLVTGARAVNLFHGFEQFDLSPDRGAIFTGDPSLGIDHLIVRVRSPTGAASSINGRLDSQIAGASLFFLDANGILIGPNGDLQADGALFLSTANFLLDDEGHRFDLDAARPDTLLTGVPSVFGFETVGSGSGATQDPDVFVRGELSSSGTPRPSFGATAVWDGAIHLSGRRVRIAADAGRRVELRAGSEATESASVGTVQAVAVGEAAAEIPIDLAGFSPTAASIGPEATLEIERDVLIVPAPIDNPSGWIGRVVLRGGRLTLAGEGRAIPRILARGGESVDPTGDAVPRPALDLSASSAIEIGPSILVTDSLATSPVEPVGAIRLEAPAVTVGAGAELQARPFLQHAGGDVEILGSSIRVEDALITGTVRSDCVDASSCGEIGAFVLEGDQIEVLGPLAEISVSTADLRNAGRVVLRASDRVVIDGGGTPLGAGRFPGIYARSGTGTGLESDAADAGQIMGDAGRIQIQAPEVVVRGGAQVSAAVFAELGGQGGEIDLLVGESLRIEGSVAEGVVSQISAESNSTTSTVGGRITVRGGEDVQENLASIRLIENARLSTSSTGSGPAGRIELTAREIELRGNSAISTESGLAAGGGEAADIRLLATRDLRILDGSRVSSTSNGDVAPGSIRLEAGNRLQVSGGSRILASAIRDVPSAPPSDDTNPLQLGNVFLSAGQEVWFSDSQIITNTRRVESGSVEFRSDNAIAIYSSSIRTEVERTDGAGGDIDVAGAILVVNDSLLSADANGLSADAGNLTLSAPIALVVDAASVLSADPGQLGVAGTIAVRAPDNDLFTTLEVIDRQVEEPRVVVVDPCDVSRNDQGSFRAEPSRSPLRSPESRYRWLGAVAQEQLVESDGCPGTRGDEHSPD